MTFTASYSLFSRGKFEEEEEQENFNQNKKLEALLRDQSSEAKEHSFAQTHSRHLKLPKQVTSKKHFGHVRKPSTVLEELEVS